MKSIQSHLSKVARFWRSIDKSWHFAITAFLIARLFYAIWSWVIVTIQPVAVQNFELSGGPILSVFSVKDNKGYVYLREVNGDMLTFQPIDLEHVRDEPTGTIWDFSQGIAMQGSYRGSTLMPAKTRPADIFPYFGATVHPGGLLSMWQRFDANWYVSIAEHGYGSTPGDDHFPPLFPLLIRILRPVFGSAFLAGLFISQAAILFALKLLYDVFLGWGEEMVARRAFIFFVIYPTFFFFFSAYSESVFLVTALLAFQSMQNRRWAWAGFWVFCAILTRLQGAALILPMLYLMWKDAPMLRKIGHWMGLFLAGLGGLYYLYLRSLQVTGGAVPFVEPEWHARLVPPWETYLFAVRTILAGNATFIDILNWALMTLFVILLLWGWKKIPLEYNLYTALSLLTILVRIVETQPLISFSRYSLTLFPAFFVLGIAGENPWLRRAIIYTSILLSLYLSGQFFIWGWVA